MNTWAWVVTFMVIIELANLYALNALLNLIRTHMEAGH